MRNIKQTCVTDFTIEADYMVVSKVAKEAVWLKKFLMDLQVISCVDRPITLYCDNNEAIAQSKNRGITRNKNV